MNDILKKMLDHPFATIIIISATTNGIANIISAVKGNEIRPIVKITTTSDPKKN